MSHTPYAPPLWHDLADAGLIRLVRERSPDEQPHQRARIVPAGEWHMQANNHTGLTDQVYDAMVIDGALALGQTLRERYAGRAVIWCVVCCELDSDAFAVLPEIASTRCPILGLDFRFDGGPQMPLTAWAFAITDASWATLLAQSNAILRSEWLLLSALDTPLSRAGIGQLFRDGLTIASGRAVGVRAAVSLSNWAERGELVAISDATLFDDLGVALEA